MQNPLGGPRSGFTLEEVMDTLALVHGTHVRHGVDVLGAGNVKLDVTLPVEPGGRVDWSYRPKDDVTGSAVEVAEVRRTAQITVVGPTALFLEGFRYRLWTELLSPLGNWIRFNLGVFIAMNPSVEDDGVVIRRRLTLAELTHRLKRPILESITVASGTNPVTYVNSSLSYLFGEAITDIPATTVTTAGTKTWQADGNTTWLQVYDDLLEVAGLDQLSVDEDTGRYRSVTFAELAGRGPHPVYGPGYRKIVTPGSFEPLLAETPNVIRFTARKAPSLATEGNGIRTKFNQSTGPASIDRRAGEQIVLSRVVDAENQTQLDALANAQAQQLFAGGGYRFIGKIGLSPLHSDRDVVGLFKPRLGIPDDGSAWNVTAWSYPLNEIQGPDDVLMPVTFEKKVVLT